MVGSDVGALDPKLQACKMNCQVESVHMVNVHINEVDKYIAQGQV
jgi:hypothetical protein